MMMITLRFGALTLEEPNPSNTWKRMWNYGRRRFSDDDTSKSCFHSRRTKRCRPPRPEPYISPLVLSSSSTPDRPVSPPSSRLSGSKHRRRSSHARSCSMRASRRRSSIGGGVCGVGCVGGRRRLWGGAAGREAAAALVARRRMVVERCPTLCTRRRWILLKNLISPFYRRIWAATAISCGLCRRRRGMKMRTNCLNLIIRIEMRFR